MHTLFSYLVDTGDWKACLSTVFSWLGFVYLDVFNQNWYS